MKMYFSNLGVLMALCLFSVLVSVRQTLNNLLTQSSYPYKFTTEIMIF